MAALAGALGELGEEQHLGERVVLQGQPAGHPVSRQPDELREEPRLVWVIALQQALCDGERDLLVPTRAQIVECVLGLLGLPCMFHG